MTSGRAKHTLNSAAKYLAENYGFRADSAIAILHEAHGKIVQESKGRMIPVYRRHQPSMCSPCLLGQACAICSEHAPTSDGRACECRDCRRGKTPPCERAYPADPAFMLDFKQALTLIHHGMAQFISQGAQRNSAIRLTFSKIAQLRDFSLKVDGRFLEALVADHFSEATRADMANSRRARMARVFWSNICGDYVEWTPKQMQASRQQIQCFT